MVAPCSCAPALMQLKKEVFAAYPVARDWGCCARDSGAHGPQSDHYWGNAWDIGITEPWGTELREKIEADERCTYTIYGPHGPNNAGHKSHHRGHGKWSQGQHGGHIHVSIYNAKRNDTQPWGISGGTVQTEEDDEMDIWLKDPNFVVKPGDNGPWVRWVQQTLDHLGHAYPFIEFSGHPFDGQFGAKTAHTVATFKAHYSKHFPSAHSDAPGENFGVKEYEIASLMIAGGIKDERPFSDGRGKPSLGSRLLDALKRR
jgi:hypothetical protein